MPAIPKVSVKFLPNGAQGVQIFLPLRSKRSKTELTGHSIDDCAMQHYIALRNNCLVSTRCVEFFHPQILRIYHVQIDPIL